MYCILDDECDFNDVNSNANINVSSNVCNDRANVGPHRNKRNRRGKRGRHSTKNILNVAFNNVNCIKGKVTEIGSFLNKHTIDVFGVVETFLKSHAAVLIKDYTWIGKNRDRKGGGGIGILVSNNIDIIDDNVLNSNADEIERLWIRIKVDDDSPCYIAVAYFPVEGTDPERTNELYNQLLSDCIRIEEENDTGLDPRIVIMADCNGRIGNHIPDCDPLINSNGQRLLDFVDDSGLTILNCTKICKGKFTWFRKDQKSAIDYMLCSSNVYECAFEYIVDDDRNLHLGSDHNVLKLSCKIKSSSSSKQKHKSNPKHVIWDIKHDQDWTNYQNEISKQFSDWDAHVFTDANSLWDNWKDKVINAATNTIGTKEINSKLRNWWDKDIDESIKKRKDACKLHRQWSKCDKRDQSEGDKLWSDYQVERHRVKSLIKEKIMRMRVNRSIHTAQEGGPQCRKFWQTLKGKKPKQDVHCIKDPGSNKIIFDRHKMNQSIMHYWGTLGKMNMSLNDNEDCNSIGVKSSVDNLRLLFDLNANINDGNNCLSNIDLNIDIITDAIKKCKNNKAHGLDEISNELLTNGGTCLNQFYVYFGNSSNFNLLHLNGIRV